MQALQVGWAGKTFALARCSDSREKKPRNRRTKEERRTMVESFIKKYQNLNKGKFPSLNLTHKEVGGSFYTVREIVRDIIQENRVLGPGNPNSKVLNLEHCLEEEHEEEYFSIGVSDQLSISTISHIINQGQEENYSLSIEHKIITEDSYEVVEPATQETSAPQSNDISASQVMHDELCHDKFSSGTYLQGDAVNLGYKETKLGNLSAGTEGNSGVYDQMHPEFQDSSSEDPRKVEQPISSSQIVPLTSPIGIFMVNGEDASSKSNNMDAETNYSALDYSVSEIPGADSLSETNTTLNSSHMQHYSYDGEDSPLASVDSKTCSQDRSQQAVGLSSSFEVSEASKSANEVAVAFMPVSKDSSINRTEPTEIHSSTAVEEVLAKLPRFPESQTFGSFAPGTTSSALQPVLQPNDFENVITDTQSGLIKTLKPSAEVKHDHIVSNTGCNTSSSSSTKANEGSETSEINPIWATIKSVLTAIVKFWTE